MDKLNFTEATQHAFWTNHYKTVSTCSVNFFPSRPEALVVDTVVCGEVDGHYVGAACVGTAGLCVSTERLQIPNHIQNLIIQVGMTCMQLLIKVYKKALLTSKIVG